MSDGYRPGRVVTERGDEVYLQCEEGHEFGVRFLHYARHGHGELTVKHCPFCGSETLQEI